MMRYLVAFAAVLAVSAALPQQPAPGDSGNQPPEASQPPAPSESTPTTTALAGTAPNKQNVSVVHENSNIDDKGNYNYSFELTNGVKVEQSGVQLSRKNESSPDVENTTAQDEGSQVVSGSYSYIAPDGQIYSVRYCADDHGYHPTVVVGKTLDEIPVLNCTALALSYKTTTRKPKVTPPPATAKPTQTQRTASTTAATTPKATTITTPAPPTSTPAATTQTTTRVAATTSQATTTTTPAPPTSTPAATTETTPGVEGE